MEAGLVKTVQRDGGSVVKNRWNLTDIRRKLNTDLGLLGATKKEQIARTGHRSVDVNTRHYETVLPRRMGELADRLPAFGMTG